MKTSELNGAALDWAVAHCIEKGFAKFVAAGYRFCPSTDWSQGGPIIEREMSQGMSIGFYPDERQFQAIKHPAGRYDLVTCGAYGPTPLIAAMRCYVASKLGDEVTIPDELMEQTP